MVRKVTKIYLRIIYNDKKKGCVTIMSFFLNMNVIKAIWTQLNPNQVKEQYA